LTDNYEIAAVNNVVRPLLTDTGAIFELTEKMRKTGKQIRYMRKKFLDQVQENYNKLDMLRMMWN